MHPGELWLFKEQAFFRNLQRFNGQLFLVTGVEPADDNADGTGAGSCADIIVGGERMKGLLLSVISSRAVRVNEAR